MTYRIVYWPWLKVVMDRFVHDWQAITIGRTIVAAAPLNDRVLEHELVHVSQWATHGWTFIFRYLWASVRAVFSGGHWYRDNEYEVDARG